MTRVAELMSSPPISVDGDATLGSVASLLAERGIHAVVVLDVVIANRRLDVSAPAHVEFAKDRANASGAHAPRGID